MSKGGRDFKLPSAPTEAQIPDLPSGRGSLGLLEPPRPAPPCPPPPLLLQDEKIHALEELVGTLQEQRGKRLSVAAGPSQCTSPWPVAPGHQGSQASVAGSGQLSLEEQRRFGVVPPNVVLRP